MQFDREPVNQLVENSESPKCAAGALEVAHLLFRVCALATRLDTGAVLGLLSKADYHKATKIWLRRCGTGCACLKCCILEGRHFAICCCRAQRQERAADVKEDCGAGCLNIM